MPIKTTAPRAAPKTSARKPIEGKRPTSVAAPTPAPSNSAAKRYETQARQEWDSAPRARGWSSSREEMRELEKEPMEVEQGTVSDIRAFSLNQWMAWRVPQLKTNEENVRIPSWR